MPKRTDYLSWDEYFMGVALLSAKRSKDPNTQVGCCIANSDNVIVSVGYNGFPRGCSDDEFPWERTGSLKDTKYPYVVHAELNAILNSKVKDMTNCKLYVALFPCNECAKAIVQSGIKQVYYLSDKYHDTEAQFVSRKIFDSANVKYTQLKFNNKEINLCLDETKI